MANWIKLGKSAPELLKLTGSDKAIAEAAETALDLFSWRPPEQAIAKLATAKTVASLIERGDLSKDLYAGKQSISALEDPRTVEITHKYLSTNTLTLRRDPVLDGDWKNTAIYMNGQRAGIFDRRSDLGSASFPVKFKSLNLVLSDGKTVAVPERDLPVIERWNRPDYGTAWPIKGNALETSVDITPFTKLNFQTARELPVGAKLIRDFPFQEVKGHLTNGLTSVPLNPEWISSGSELAKLTNEQYEQLLGSLKGKFTDTATLPPWAEFTADHKISIPDSAIPPERTRNDYRERYFGDTHTYTKPLPALKDGRPITVESVDFSRQELSLKRESRDGKWLEQGIYSTAKNADGLLETRRIGDFDRFGPLERLEFPAQVNTATVKLSNGEVATVSDRTVSIIKDWGEQNQYSGRFDPKLEEIARKKPVKITPFESLSFAEAQALKPGREFMRFPYQEANGQMTNGEHSFEIRRTRSNDVPEERWQDFLQGLKGKMSDEVKLPEWVKLKAGGPEFDESVRLKPRPTVKLGHNVDTPVTLSRSDFGPQLDASKIPAVLIEHGGEKVKVNSITLSQHDVSLKLEPPDGKWLDQGVYINGKRIGIHDATAHPQQHEFPMTVNTAELHLSDGRSLAVSDRSLRIITDLRAKEGAARAYPKYEDIFSAKPIVLSPWAHFDYAKASELRPGTEITKRFPFLWNEEGELTNGVVSLPEKRPEGSEWRKYPISAVKEGYWESYKKALHRTYVDDLVESQPQILKAIEEARIPKESPLSAKQREVQSIVNGEMWSGQLSENNAKLTHVSLGQSVIFKMPLENGKILHIVDNPGDGAIYLFNNYNDAEELASGYMSRMAARELGHPFVIHKGEWKEKLSEEIRKFVEKMNR